MHYLLNQYESQLHRRQADYYTEDQKQLIKESDSKPPSAVAAAVNKSLHASLRWPQISSLAGKLTTKLCLCKAWGVCCCYCAMFSKRVVKHVCVCLGFGARNEAPFGHTDVVRHHQQPRNAALCQVHLNAVQNAYTSAASHRFSTGDEGFSYLLCVFCTRQACA